MKINCENKVDINNKNFLSMHRLNEQNISVIDKQGDDTLQWGELLTENSPD